MASLLNPDEIKQFFVNNNYPTQYNDGLRAYLRVFYSMPEASLADLFVKYIVEHGIDLANPVVVGDRLLMETLDFLLLEDDSFILLE